MKRNKAEELSAYVITWAEIVPTRGKYVPMCDQRHLGVIVPCRREERVFKHFPNIDKARAWVARVDGGRLSKRYEVRFFTDKQFGMRSREDGYKVPYTKKQFEKVTII